LAYEEARLWTSNVNPDVDWRTYAPCSRRSAALSMVPTFRSRTCRATIHMRPPALEDADSGSGPACTLDRIYAGMAVKPDDHSTWRLHQRQGHHLKGIICGLIILHSLLFPMQDHGLCLGGDIVRSHLIGVVEAAAKKLAIAWQRANPNWSHWGTQMLRKWERREWSAGLAVIAHFAYAFALMLLSHLGLISADTLMFQWLARYVVLAPVLKGGLHLGFHRVGQSAAS
jgi:hypothetical protein